MSRGADDRQVQRRQVGPEQAGQRLDVFVAGACPDLSRAAAQRLIREGRVLLDGETAKPSRPVSAGSLVQVEIPPPRPYRARPEPIPLDVVYEDADLVVVNKPVGMVVHPAAGNWEGTLVNALLAHCGDLAGIGGELRPGIVHRLDKDTSGLIVAAKNDHAHRHLQRQISRRTAERRYRALCWGADMPEELEVDASIGRHPRHRQRMAVLPHGGRPARTALKLLRALPPMALVEARLRTGRTHQIRVHLHHIGHAVVGDPVYGRAWRLPRGSSPALRQALEALPGQALHARLLSFEHPRTGQQMRFEAELPVHFRRLLAALEAQQ